MAAAVRDDLVLERASHTYHRRLPDGSWEPVRASVTGILRATVLREVWAQRNREAFEAKGVIGTYVHAAAAIASTGEWDRLDTLDQCPRAVPYVDAWADCVAREGLAGLHHDLLVHHPVHGYAGEIDLGGYRYGEPAIVDLKIGDAHGARWQLFAYLDALWYERERQPWFFDGVPLISPIQIARYVVRLLPNGKYTIDRCDNYSGDSTVWHACLTVFNQQRILGLWKEATP